MPFWAVSHKVCPGRLPARMAPQGERGCVPPVETGSEDGLISLEEVFKIRLGLKEEVVMFAKCAFFFIF